MSEKLIASSVADALEAEYLAVANGQKKPGKLDLQTLVRAVQCIRELERASQPGSGETVKVDAVHANFTPFYIMSNVRRICAQYYNNHRANWVLAMDVFAVGSRSARQICLDAGIDPDGYTVIRVSTGDTARASLDGRS